jgi:histidyl-tRNA synthetase
LIDSEARVDFNQGLDARFITAEIAEMLKQIKTKMWHFAFDFMKNERQIIKGLKTFVDVVHPNDRNAVVYMLTNFDTTFEQDLYRVQMIKDVGLSPDVRIYRKNSLPRTHILRDLQRWCNNRYLYRSIPDFMDYVPRTDGLTIKQIYFGGIKNDE